MTLGLESSSPGETDVLAVSGEVDVQSAPQLAERIDAVLGRGGRRLVIDLTAVAFLDSAGLGVLAGATRASADAGTSITVVCPPRLRKLFTITGLDSVVGVVPTLADAGVVRPDDD